MKKVIAFILSAIMIAALFTGCNQESSAADYTVNLAERPSCESEIIKIGDTKALKIEFELAEAGYFKMFAYDNTEYDEWPEYVNSKLELLNEKGTVLHGFEDVSNGYCKATRFEKGTVTARLTFDKRFKGMNEVCIGWAFAPDTDTPQAVAVDGGEAYSKIQADKHAYFTFTVSENGLYKINCGEACVFECNSKFKIERADGTLIADNVFIHETEWWSRKLFLTKGDYKLTTKEVNNLARCSVTRQEEQPQTTLTEIPENIVLTTTPIAIGIVNAESKVIRATFTAGEHNRLDIEADGLGTYYDSQQGFSLVVTDSKGKVVMEPEDCESGMYDISDLKGKYTVTLTPHGNGIYQLRLATYNPEE